MHNFLQKLESISIVLLFSASVFVDDPNNKKIIMLF